jgi:hypothetical protein
MVAQEVIVALGLAVGWGAGLVGLGETAPDVGSEPGDARLGEGVLADAAAVLTGATLDVDGDALLAVSVPPGEQAVASAARAAITPIPRAAPNTRRTFFTITSLFPSRATPTRRRFLRIAVTASPS